MAAAQASIVADRHDSEIHFSEVLLCSATALHGPHKHEQPTFMKVYN